MKYCPYCGLALEDEMAFCPKCGKKYSGGLADSITTDPVQISDSISTQPKRTDSASDKRRIKVWPILVLIGVLAAAVVFFSLRTSRNTSSTHPAEASPPTTEEPALSFSDSPDAIQAASNSVVMLSCYDQFGDMIASGSAFAAFEPGIFVTNFHVIEGEVQKVQAQTETGEVFGLKWVIAYDEDRDIAILRTDEDPEISVLPVNDTVTLEKGEKIVAIGSPLGLLNSISTGVYSGITQEAGQEYFQFTAPISHGSSGGALFNNAGEVVGVTSASYTEGQNLNLAVPMQYVTRLWSANRGKTPMSFSAFYRSFDHVFTVDYLISHINQLDQSQVRVCGYVSTIHQYQDGQIDITIVAQATSVLGEVANSGHTTSSLEENQLFSFLAVFCTRNPRNSTTIRLGDFVTVSGKARYVPGDQGAFVALTDYYIE